MFSVLRSSWEIPDGLGPIGKGLVVTEYRTYFRTVHMNAEIWNLARTPSKSRIALNQ